MKSFKKLSILLALCMACIFVFAACGPKGGGKQEDPTEAQTEAQTEEATTEEATTKEATPAGKTSLKGSVSGTTYTNTYLNLKFNATDDWVFYTDAELAAENNVSESEFVNNFDSLVEDDQIYDLYAIRSDRTNINMIIASAEGLDIARVRKYVEELGPSMEESLAEQGLTDISWKMSDTSLPLKDYAVFEISSNYDGVAIYQKQAYALVDGYSFIITITCVGTDECDEIFGYFTKIK